MRAARLLQILLILQNRGRQTSVQLARELEVAPRTILRDVDAMTEAGLPIIVFQGNQGGIELGFNYRTRLTGLAEDEAKALGLILQAENPMISALGLGPAARQARAKLFESLPDTTRSHAAATQARFRLALDPAEDDPRIAAIAQAVEAATIVRLRFASPQQQEVHPIALEMTSTTWRLYDGLSKTWIELEDWGRVNVSRLEFKAD